MSRLSREVSIMAITASAYAFLTVSLGDFSYSWIQVRISESLTPLPFLLGFPSVVGLTLGCLIANIFSPVGLVDIIFGPVATLIAAILSWKIHFGRKIIACIYPIIVNALVVSAYVSLFYSVPYTSTVFTISVGEAIAVVLVGYPLLAVIENQISI